MKQLKNNFEPTEFEHQVAFVDWLDYKGLKYTAIPNSTYTTSHNQKYRNWAMGLRPGLPDLLVITPKGLLFIEMKRTKKSSTSLEQKSWIDALQKCPGVEARICFGSNEAVKFVEEFLE